MTKSEQIDLEYMVEFEDGVRPRIQVYGIDYETKEIYGADGGIGVTAKVGFLVQASKGLEEGFPGIVGVEKTLIVSRVTAELTRTKIPETDGWEQKMHEDARKEGVNVIKIKNPEHINSAVDRHTDLYTEQFHELAERYSKVLDGFVAEHPNYIKYK